MNKIFLIAFTALITLSHTAQAQFFRGKFEQDSLERIYLEIPILDLPYQHQVVSATDNKWTAITNQSMATTLALCEDAQVAAHYGIRKAFGERKTFSRLAAWAFDFVSMYLPFGSSWAHEEYHRAVMGYRGVESYDEVWDMKFFASTISVSHETDEAMAALHDNHIDDFIRMNAAGLEAQTHLVQTLQRNDFFYHRNLMNSFSYWMNILNNWAYLGTCSDVESDKDVNEMNAKEPQIKQRDFTGFDLSAWAYELHHPGMKYADRGIHPSGIGIDRYITSGQIGQEGLDYLKKQANRELLNLLSPMMIGFDRFRLMSTRYGDIYGNFAVRHYLTHFGDDISVDLMLETPWLKLVAVPHIYSNNVSNFAGFELGVVDKTFMHDKLRLDATAKLWSQPESFNAKKGKFGGMIQAQTAFALTRRWEAYLGLSAKTAGWQQGDVHLNDSFSCRAGLKWLMFDARK